MSINVVPWDDWCDTPKIATEGLTPPISKVVLSLENDFEPCHNREECIKRIQEIHIHYIKEKACSNTPFNFVVGNDGNVYEGRGWTEKPLRSQQVPELSDKTVDIAVLGTKAGRDIANLALQLAKDFVKEGVEKNLISTDYTVKGYDGEKKMF